MYPKASNPICQKCGLHEGCIHPFMKSYGSSEPTVLVIGEAPGKDEDKAGIPFVGEAGNLLRNVLSEAGLEESDIRYTNVVRCRPPNNKITKKAIDCCKQFALHDIVRYNPKLVFVMGNSPLYGILGQSGISNWNGVKIDKELEGIKYTFVPLYHPAHMLYDNSHLDEWLEALISIVDADENEDKEQEYERLYPKTVEEVLEMAAWLQGHKWVSYDTETSLLDPLDNGAMLLAVSFASEGRAYSIPIEHPEFDWCTTNGSTRRGSDYDIVIQALIDILYQHNGNIIGHNLKFDFLQSYAYLKMDDLKAGGDTMLLSHLLDSRQGIHGLKRLAGLHLGMYEYDNDLQEYKKTHPEANYEKGGSMAFVPLEKLLPYSAMDAEATYKLHKVLYAKLSDKQKILYRTLLLPTSDMLTRMQMNGLAVDQYVATRYEYLYQKQQQAVFLEILADNKVKAMMKSKGGKYVFNPNSSVQVAELLFDRYRLKPTETTAGGKPSTSAAALKPYMDKPIVKNIRYYKLLTKMLGTYLTPCASGKWLSSGDGRARTTHNMHGTRTGRLSSSSEDGLNMQNIPTPEKEPGTLLEQLPIKNVFTHSWGYENG